MSVIRYDMIAIKAQVSKEGWIRDRPVVTRAGIFTYKTANGKVRKEYRPDEEVFKDDSLGSLCGIPVTDSHHGLLNQDNVGGIVGSVISQGNREDSNVVADVIIHNAKQIGDKRDLSLGYECDIEDTPGTFNGEKYDCVQKNIRYNHLAIVAKGRAGNARLRLDSSDGSSFIVEDDDMPEVKLVTVRLDEIDYQAAPEVVNALAKSKDQLKAIQAKFDSIEAERDTLKAAVAKHADELKAAHSGARAEIKARIELEKVAESHQIKFDENDADRDIKTKIVEKLNSDLKFDGKSDDYVDSAFDIVLATAKNKKLTNQMSRLDSRNNVVPGPAPGTPAAQTARDKMLSRIRGEKADTDDKSAA